MRRRIGLQVDHAVALPVAIDVRPPESVVHEEPVDGGIGLVVVVEVELRDPVDRVVAAGVLGREQCVVDDVVAVAERRADLLGLAGIGVQPPLHRVQLVLIGAEGPGRGPVLQLVGVDVQEDQRFRVVRLDGLHGRVHGDPSRGEARVVVQNHELLPGEIRLVRRVVVVERAADVDSSDAWEGRLGEGERAGAAGERSRGGHG